MYKQKLVDTSSQAGSRRNRLVCWITDNDTPLVSSSRQVLDGIWFTIPSHRREEAQLFSDTRQSGDGSAVEVMKVFLFRNFCLSAVLCLCITFTFTVPTGLTRKSN